MAALVSGIYRPESVEDAIETLTRLGSAAAPLGGATWVMRAPLRREHLKSTYVALTALPELRRIEHNGTTLLGSCLTHSDIAGLEPRPPGLGALVEAAAQSAFPAVRNVATLGGNIRAPFPESDLVPALLACDAVVQLISSGGAEELPLADYLALRDSRPVDEIIHSVAIPAAPRRRSAYERLTVRGGGEYPLASVAIALDVGEDGRVVDARVAVGVVESVARRSEAAERVLRGERPDPGLSAEVAAAARSELKARSGLDAPGWYRVAVLGALVDRALARLGRTEGG